MRGGWSGFGMETVGIHPNDFDLDPNKIPTGGVVQNCPFFVTRMKRPKLVQTELFWQTSSDMTKDFSKVVIPREDFFLEIP